MMEIIGYTKKRKLVDNLIFEIGKEFVSTELLAQTPHTHVISRPTAKSS